MNVVLLGAFGNLGREILKELIKNNHKVKALDISEKEIEGIDKKDYEFHKIDVTKKETLENLFNNQDVVISTVGLTTSSSKVTNYDIDYQGNLNILNEAKKSNVHQFVYISVIHADLAKDVPMVHAKYLFEEELKKSGLNYVIHRPTGYFYDIVKVFRPMIEKGCVNLLGKKDASCNVIDTTDFAEFIVKTMNEKNVTYNIGGKETYTYYEIAKMCFEEAKKEVVVKRAPVFLFTILASLPKNKKNGKWAVIKFSKFTLTHDMVGETKYGEKSFKQYIHESFNKGN